MLVLSRKPFETVTLTVHGIEIIVTLTEIREHSVRLGFDAPKEVMIVRSELIQESVTE